MSIFDKISERVGEIVDEVFLPDTVRKVHDDARRLIQKTSYEHATRMLRETLIQHPDVFRTHHLIGLAEFQRENLKSAIDAFERANQIKESPESLFYAGLALESLGDFRLAHRYFARATSFADLPFIFELEFALGRVNHALEHYSKATRYFYRGQKIEPDNFELRVYLALSLCELEMFEDALQHLTLNEIPLDHALAQVVKATILESQKEFIASQNAWQIALESSEENIINKAYIGLGRVQNAQLAYGETILLLYRKNLPEIFHYDRHLLLGRAFLELQNETQAAIEYGKALLLNPLGGEALLGRAFVALKTGEDAESFFQRVLEIPDTTIKQRAYFGLGLVKIRKNKMLSARHMFEEALRYEGNLQVKIWEVLGDISLEYGDAAECLWWYKKIECFITEDANSIKKERLSKKEKIAIKTLQFSWRLPATLKNLDDVRHVLNQLGEFLSFDARLGHFMKSYQVILERVNAPLSVAVLGEFNAGKSSVVNALMGEKVVPVGVLPTTAQSGVIRFASRKAARIMYVGGKVEETNFESAKRAMKSNAEEIESVEFLYPHPQLRMVNFWDTPGFNALEEGHERVAKKALNTAEAILWVMDANQVLSETQREQIESVEDSAERLIIIINKIDRVSQDAVLELKKYVQKHIGNKILEVFALSAKQAEDQATYGVSQFEVFSDFFDENVVQKAGRIKTIEVTNTLRSFAVTLDAFQRGMLLRVEKANAALIDARTMIAREQNKIPSKARREELQSLEDWTEITLQNIETEIVESLTPMTGWTGKSILEEEDARYILEQIDIYLSKILDHSYQRLTSHLSKIESRLSLQIAATIRDLPLQNARSIQKHLQSFFDETRRLRTQLDVKVLRGLRISTQAKIEAAGVSILNEIVDHQKDRARWKPLLRGLFPDFETTLIVELDAWFSAFFEVAESLIERVNADLEILELESKIKLSPHQFLEFMNSI